MNYETHDSELLAVIQAISHWHHYLKGAKHRFTVLCDHANLEYFMTTKTLSWHQAQ